jgi:hypothetical protein
MLLQCACQPLLRYYTYASTHALYSCHERVSQQGRPQSSKTKTSTSLRIGGYARGVVIASTCDQSRPQRTYEFFKFGKYFCGSIQIACVICGNLII